MTKRICRVLLVTAVLLTLAAVTAQGQTTIVAPPEAHWPYQQWVEEASVPTPPVTVEVIESATCEGGPALGCADPTHIWIDIWPRTTRRTFLHELGHVFAFTFPAFADPYSERFADIYRRCALAELRPIRPAVSYSIGEGLVRGVKLRSLCREIIQYGLALGI